MHSSLLLIMQYITIQIFSLENKKDLIGNYISIILQVSAYKTGSNLKI